MKMQMHDAKMNTICILGVVNEAKKKNNRRYGMWGCRMWGCRMWASDVGGGGYGNAWAASFPQNAADDQWIF